MHFSYDPSVCFCPATSLVDVIDSMSLLDYIEKSSNVDKLRQALINLELKLKQYPSELVHLFNVVADYFNIYLHIIVNINGKYENLNQHRSSNIHKLEKQAFLIFYGDYTIGGPLYVHNQNGEKQFVFAADDMRIKHYVEKYIENLNQIRMFFFLN